MELDNDHVQGIHDELRRRVGERRHAQFFKQVTRFEVAGDELVVYVGSPYLQSWLQRHFQRDLTEAARVVLGDGVRLHFDVDARLAVPASENGAAEKEVSERSTSRPADPSGAVPRRAASRRRFADFAQFVVGPCNDLAVTAARKVAASPDGELNPLFLYGGVGCGKTHLLEAVYRQVRQQYPALQVLYLTAENFTNYFTQALRERTLVSFHQRFRGVHVLLVDDTDFLTGKRGLQQEFLHTVQTLEGNGGQMAFSADRHPRLLAKLSDELVTRFLSGMVCRIEPPDPATRLEIVRRRAARLHLACADEALRFVAECFVNNVRELEGAVNCLHTYQTMTNQRITRRLAREVLSRLERDCIRIIRLADVERAVCRLFGVNEEDLKSSRRARSISQPRMLAMYLARRHTQCAYSEIGQYFGGRNHATVIAAEKKVRGLIRDEATMQISAQTWPVREVVESLEQQLKTG